jgi:hypothetical protein
MRLVHQLPQSPAAGLHAEAAAAALLQPARLLLLQLLPMLLAVLHLQAYWEPG